MKNLELARSMILQGAIGEQACDHSIRAGVYINGLKLVHAVKARPGFHEWVCRTNVALAALDTAKTVELVDGFGNVSVVNV